jgi:hypothetical protein
MKRQTRTLLLASLLSLAAALPARAQQPETAPTRIYFVRHGEIDGTDPAIPLSARGHERAAELVRVMERVRLTHVFSSHTLRSQQAVRPTADAHGLSVTPMPPLGTVIDGHTVTGASASRLAIGPLGDALAGLPPGSAALVGVNGDNLFAILNRLGVPLDASCTLGGACVPCLDSTCFPVEYDNLWVATWRGAGQRAELVWLKYGTP